jgi:Tfp pilus assembly protein PilN
VSQVNLLPPDVLQSLKYRRLTLAIAIAGAVALVAVFGFYLLQTGRLAGVNDDIENQSATNASIQASIAEKQRFADLQAEAQAQQQKLAAAFAGEVSFSALLMDVSRVIPSEAFLDNLAVQLTAGEVTAEEPTPTGLVGAITASGQAVSIDTLSDFLLRLEQVKGWVNPWMPTVAANSGAPGYTYSVSVDLTEDVVTDRGKGAQPDAG